MKNTRDIDDEKRVRTYSPIPSMRLIAYRDGDEHVVQRRDDDGIEREKRISATVDDPIFLEKRWTIPDNWVKVAHSSRDTIAYGIYWIPESEKYAEVSIPTNDHVRDAWYGINSVGQLEADYVGEVAQADTIREHALEAEEYDSPNDVVSGLNAVAKHRGVIAEHFSEGAEMTIDDPLYDAKRNEHDMLRCDDQFVVESRHPIVETDWMLRDCGITDRETRDAVYKWLRDTDVFPNRYQVWLSVE